AAFRSEGAIAVLDDRQSTGRRHQPSCRRYVDRSRKIAARAAAVGEQICGRWERMRGTAECLGSTDQLLGRLPFHSQRNERRSHQGLAQAALDDAAEQLASGRSVEVFALEKTADSNFGAGVSLRLNRNVGAGKSQTLAHENSPETKKPAIGGRA